MTTKWIDFKAVKEAVSIESVLDHYGIRNLRRSGNELRGPCPIHKGSPQSKNFSVNVSKNAFKCFSKDCGAHGNVLDFVAAFDSCSVRDAAIKLRDLFKVGESQPESTNEVEGSDEAAEVPRGIYRAKDGAVFEVMTTAISAEDFEPLVVYRELFGEYQVFVGSRSLFTSDVDSDYPPEFTLLKPL